MAKIDAFFNLMNETGASDLHLATGSQPILRVRGEMERVKFPPLENDDLKSMLYEIAPEYKVKVFEETGDVDFGYEIPGVARYRANFFNQKYGVAAVFRQIPSSVLTADQLGLPPIMTISRPLSSKMPRHSATNPSCSHVIPPLKTYARLGTWMILSMSKN